MATQQPSQNSEQTKSRRHTPANRFRTIVDLIMLSCFLIAMVTGIIKLPSLYEPLMKLFDIISFKTFSTIHDISGIILGVAIVMHLALSWKRFAWLIKRR